MSQDKTQKPASAAAGLNAQIGSNLDAEIEASMARSQARQLERERDVKPVNPGTPQQRRPASGFEPVPLSALWFSMPPSGRQIPVDGGTSGKDRLAAGFRSAHNDYVMIQHEPWHRMYRVIVEHAELGKPTGKQKWGGEGFAYAGEFLVPEAWAIGVLAAPVVVAPAAADLAPQG